METCAIVPERRARQLGFAVSVSSLTLSHLAHFMALGAGKEMEIRKRQNETACARFRRCDLNQAHAGVLSQEMNKEV